MLSIEKADIVAKPIRVSAKNFYLKQDLLPTAGPVFSWIYVLVVENFSKNIFNLKYSHWWLVDDFGITRKIDEGVISQGSIINPQTQAEYVSIISLPSSGAIMIGECAFGLDGDDSDCLVVKIGPLLLRSDDNRPIN